MKLIAPDYVADIMDTLKAHGYEAVAVGGCVRDSLLGRKPKDWDVATSALPEEVMKLFPRSVGTGLQHGTVTVLTEVQTVEVTTFRIDGAYEDGRHPESVQFTGNLADDLRRRDFTINAMAWDPERGITDLFGGAEDLRRQTVRTVGNAGERFREDALRMLRAVRFSAQLGFAIEEDTLSAAFENRERILSISAERIRDELTGILCSEDPMKLMLLRRVGLLKLILPEVEQCFLTPQHNPHHRYNVGEHSLRAAATVENEKCLRWTMLLHDAGKPAARTTGTDGIDHFYGHAEKSVLIAGEILHRLKFDNKSRDRILRLIRHHDREIVPQTKAVARAILSVGEDLFPDLLKVKRADGSARVPEDVIKGHVEIDEIEALYAGILEAKNCLSLKDLKIDGHDLAELGVKGRQTGQILDQLLEKVLAEPELNEHDKLVRLAKTLIGFHA